MAEAIVGPLLSKLQDVALAEAKALAGVSREIHRLRYKLMWLHAVVHETDLRSRQDGNQLVRVLACQMREISFEAEDAIDKFYLKADLSRSDWRRAATVFLANFGTQIHVRYALSRKVKSLNARLEDIVDNSTKYNSDHGGSGNNTWRASSTIPLLRLNWDEDMEASEESDLAGSCEGKFKLKGRSKDRREELKKHLVNDKNNSGVICVVGESGVGKRALVRSVYEEASVKEQFKVCIWESFRPDTSNSSNIVQHISDKLKELDQDPYLLVIESPMSTTLWNEIRSELPEVRNGSRIVLTATSWHDKKHTIIQLDYLCKEECQSLFNKKLGLNGRTKNYRIKMMKEVREHIEDLTRGVPLAVVLLAKLMRTMDLNKWQPAYEYIMNNYQDDRLKTVVSLSVDDLPDDLKSCLLYTAGFPDRCAIDANHLVRLWVAEGFLTRQHGVEPQELGQRYLKELIFRGLLQLLKKRDQGQGDVVESVAVHEGIQPFFRSEAQRTGFMDFHIHAPDTARRLALWNSSPKFPEFIRLFKKLRTVVSRNFGRHDNVDSASKESKKEGVPSFLQLLRGSHFLRVIDIEDLDIGKALPDEIGDSVHLQYLGVRGSPSLEKVPSSIGNLSKLQTLDVRRTGVTKLPRSFWKIAALCHVLGDKLLFPTSSGDLKLIRTLEKVVIADGTSGRKILGLRLLHRLHVVELKESQGQDVGHVLDQLTFLESLSLSGDVIPAAVLESASLQHIVSLEINGRLLQPQNMLANLLTHLVLNSTHVGQAFVDMLAKLPVLADLTMRDDAYVDETLVFRSDGHGFSSLTVLRLSRLPKLKTIEEVGDTALQKLTTFQKIGMPHLSLEGAPHLSSL